MTDTAFTLTRRASLLGLVGFAVAGCGGGDSGTPVVMAGSVQTRTIASQSTGSSYPLNIYLPPGNAADRATLPVVYLLDGEARFQAVVDLVEASHRLVIIVGIGNEALRGRDYVPANLCTPGGGGQGAYFDFLRLELTPYIEANVGGHPQRRILLGHSHGGSFVLYALFAQPAAGHHFMAYLASDSSIDCMSATVYGWDSAYAAANPSLPVRLHISYSANLANSDFSAKVASHHYVGLTMAAKSYDGGHIGMIPAAFGDALAFALA
jgi:hypothetical protein